MGVSILQLTPMSLYLLIGWKAYLNSTHHPKRAQNQKALSEDSG